MGAREKKEMRLAKLEKMLQENPLHSDGELARRLGVSIQTVRLDRQQIGIPELRERARQVAVEHLRDARTFSGDEIVGEVTHLIVGKEGTSQLRFTEAMLQSSSIARGHYIFAQANSLAVAIVDAPTAMTALSRVRNRRPVLLGEVVEAKAHIVKVVGARNIIRVVSHVGNEIVFSGKFYIIARDRLSRP
ncbi:transcription factor FapR [Heliobacillus mobilis]|uniref:Transcription factor FapR n=1 Tax=Heliobacterium mobile TaxID=28064 RepID=A0A6I3SBI0_HELMO|nr:transcription factor FapR [Heliobacterium mobile]MTV47662.1 transcription factor FapR [Heliobacterium mobile]